MDPLTTVRLGLSQAFCNKHNLTGSDRAFADSFKPSTATPAQIVEHLLAGKAITAGYFQGNGRTNATFISAQLVMVDYDLNVSIADVLANDFVRRHALLVYPTPSSTVDNRHTRIVFLLSEPGTEVERVRAINRGVTLHLGFDADPASFKPAQLWYGSTNRVEQPYVNLTAVLPIELAGALTQDDARLEYNAELARRANPPRKIDAGSDQAQRVARRRYERALDKLDHVPEGQSRPTAIFSTASYLYGLVLGGWPLSEQDVERGVTDAAARNGALQKYGKHEIDRWIANARKAATAIPLELPNYDPNVRGEQKTGSKAAFSEFPEPATRVRPREMLTKVDISEAIRAREIPAYEPPSPLTTWEARNIATAGYWETVIVDLAARATGTPGSFTAAMLAGVAGVSDDTARNWITAARMCNAVAEVSTEKIIGISVDSKDIPIIFSVDEKSRRYQLTTDRIWSTVRAALPVACFVLMDSPQPRAAHRDAIAAAGLDRADDLEAVTTAISSTDAAAKVESQADERARYKAEALIALQHNDTAIFAPDTLPTSKGELRVALLDAYLASFPEGTQHLHADLMWAAGGVKQHSVSNVMKHSRFMPSALPVWTPVQLGAALGHADVSAACREHRGAPAAWIDAQGISISPYSAHPPKNATGVLLNCGKTYSRRAEQSAIAFDEPADASTATSTEPTRSTSPETKPTEAEQDAARARRLARADLLPVFKGCLMATGWRRSGGAFPHWYRQDDEPTFDDTLDGMAAALLYDYDRSRDSAPIEEYPPVPEDMLEREFGTAAELAEVAF